MPRSLYCTKNETLERETGVEPVLTIWETIILAAKLLSHALFPAQNLAGEVRFELTQSRRQRAMPLPYLGYSPIIARLPFVFVLPR